ncbi:unnamed protein product, partial [Rangifer tarandus platyrhynchus]
PVRMQQRSHPDPTAPCAQPTQPSCWFLPPWPQPGERGSMVPLSHPCLGSSGPCAPLEEESTRPPLPGRSVYNGPAELAQTAP